MLGKGGVRLSWLHSVTSPLYTTTLYAGSSLSLPVMIIIINEDKYKMGCMYGVIESSYFNIFHHPPQAPSILANNAQCSEYYNPI